MSDGQSPFGQSGPSGASAYGGGYEPSGGDQGAAQYGAPASYGGEQYGQQGYGGEPFGGGQYGSAANGVGQYGTPAYGGDQYGADQYGGEQPAADQYGQQTYGGDPYGQQTYGGDDYAGAGYGSEGYAGGEYAAPGGYEGYDAYGNPQGATASGDANPYGSASGASGEAPSGILSIFALIAGIVGLLLALIPFVGLFFAFLFLVGAIVLGILALTMRKFQTKKPMAITGAILGGFGLIIGVVNPFVSGAIADGIINATAGTASVELKVTDARGHALDVSYTVSNYLSGDKQVSESDQKNSAATPWSTSFEVPYKKDGYEYVSLNAITSSYEDYDDTVTCEILVDGKSVDTDTGSGSVYCSLPGSLYDATH